MSSAVHKALTDKDRIRLAEAMFPDYAFAQNTNGEWLMCHNDDWGNDSRIRNVPDPFTDANNDYAVLEWMRQQKKETKWNFMDHYFNARLAAGELDYILPVYQIGDYARAALKVIDEASDE
jgi:hypothetical protein